MQQNTESYNYLPPNSSQPYAWDNNLTDQPRLMVETKSFKNKYGIRKIRNYPPMKLKVIFYIYSTKTLIGYHNLRWSVI